MRGLFAPPVFADQEKSLRARSLFYLLWFTAGGVTVAMAGMALAQPELGLAAGATVAVTLAVNLALLLVVQSGRIRLASLLYVVWGIGLIAERAVDAGGIRSPGVPMLYAFALIAGFLLGEMAGMVTAVICALVGLVLVGVEHFGFLPVQTLHYSAISYWWLSFLYLGIVMMLVRLAIRAVRQAFHSQQSELAERRGAERKLQVALEASRAAEAEALALKRQLETLVDKAKVGILIHRKFKPLVANPELAAIFGYGSVEEVMALPDVRVVMTEQVRERAAENYLARIEGADPRSVIPVRCQRKDGSWIDIEARAFPITWNGEPSLCSMITDVTQQRKLEAQLRQAHRLEAVGQLTGGIAHDFNNLLTVILGNADALERMPAGDPAAQELAGLTRAAAERGSQLTNRLLSFSRQQTLNIQPADVEALVTAAHGLIRHSIGDKVEIRIVHGTGLWRAFTDAGQMESALLNLAINARDAMPDGGVLTIQTRNVARDDPEIARLAVPDETGQVPPPEDYVLVAVSDTGTGMDEETRARAFEPFFTTKDVGKGSGLGLSMVYGFVKQLRGLIRIESEPGRGTTVKLYLPRAPQATETRTAEARTSRPLVGGSETILLVEDNDLVREQCTIQLKRLGYHVLAAEDGEEALAILEREEGIRLLFSDVSLPKGLNGPELAKRARARRPGLPVLLATGYAAGRIEIDNLGMRVAVLSKPYYQDQLAAVIRDLLT